VTAFLAKITINRHFSNFSKFRTIIVPQNGLDLSYSKGIRFV